MARSIRWRSVNQFEKFEDKPAERRAGGQVHDVVLFGVKTAQGDDRWKSKHRRAEAWKQMQRGERGHGRVHARKAVRAPVEALYEGEKPFGAPAPGIARAPRRRRRDGQKREERHLKREEQRVADGNVEIMPRRSDRPVDGDNDRVIEEAVN